MPVLSSQLGLFCGVYAHKRTIGPVPMPGYNAPPSPAEAMTHGAVFEYMPKAEEPTCR
jgi:hypothetical protein